MSAKTHPLRGYLYIAGATFLWGVAATLGRAVFTGRLLPAGTILKPIDPVILSQSRTSLSLLMLLPTLAFTRGLGKLALPRQDLFRCLILGVFGVAASNYTYYLAIEKTNVATAIIVQYTAPVWVLLYTVARGLQRATLKRFAAVALAVAGSVLAVGLVGTGGLHLNVVGVGAALLAAFSFAFYNVGGHSILERYDRWTVLFWALVAASVFWILINPPARVIAAHYSGGQWAFLLIFSLLSVLAPFSLYFAGLQHLEPTRAIIGSCLEPVFSIIIAAIALKEGVRPVQTLGIVIVLIAIVVVQLPDRDPRAQQTVIEPME